METFTLFFANMTILMVLSVSFFGLARTSDDGPYWRTLSVANLVFALALGLYALEERIPLMGAFLVPNLLLVFGFSLHWNAASRFVGQPPVMSRYWLPAATVTAFAVAALAQGSYGPVYIGTNLLVVVLAGATALSYAGKPLSGLKSRYGLVLAFLLMVVEGTVRTVHAFTLESAMGVGLTNDLILTAHLLVSLAFVTLSGAFALGISFERTARQQREFASRDPLTGVYNRAEFNRRLEALLSVRTGASFAILQFDLDHFKRLNDRYGHVAGDDALIAVTGVIGKSIREGDCLARLGGEEFGVLLPNVDRDLAIAIAERIRRTVETMPLDFASDGYRITLSAGLYHGTGGQMTGRSLMQTVDQSLYRSKNNGRNQVTLAEAA